MLKNISIIGCGTDADQTITVEGRKALAGAGLVIGAERLTEVLSQKAKAEAVRIAHVYKADEVADAVGKAGEDTIAILVSGDSGFYSGATGYLQALKAMETEKDPLVIRVYPGLSSVSYLSAKTGITWDDAEIYSLHGRQQNFYGALCRGSKTILLGGDGFTEVIKGLCANGFGEREVWVGERLGSPKEKILHATVEELRGKVKEPLSLMMIGAARNGHRRTSGIEDDAFIRDAVPMTKSEVRAVVLSRLAIGRSDIVYDIGAGSGSVSVEAAIAAPFGRVYAIERKDAACKLIKKNKEKFMADNIEVINGEAPAVFNDLPAPDAVFIGGSDGLLTEIFVALVGKNPSARVVLTAVTIETLQNATKAIEECGYQCTEITQIAATRYNLRGIYHMPETQSPVWVITAELASEKKVAMLQRRRELMAKLKESK